MTKHIPKQKSSLALETIIKKFIYTEGNIVRKSDGSKIGYVGAKGYLYLCCYVGHKRSYFKVHHVVWFICKGYWPQKQIDHIDRCPSNNNINNLREATDTENVLNRLHPVGKTGSRGVRKSGSKYQARLVFGKITYHLGTYISIEEAYSAYNKKYVEIHGKEPLI